MNPRIKEWLKQTRTNTPVMVIDLEEVRKKYHQLKKALRHTHLHYAVKANPEFEVLRLLAREGAGFDIASPMELDSVLLTGVDPKKSLMVIRLKNRAILPMHGNVVCVYLLLTV